MMAICIKGHYSTRDKKDKSARATEKIKTEWQEYFKDKARGVRHTKQSQIRAIRELEGVGMADRIKRETE